MQYTPPLPSAVPDGLVHLPVAAARGPADTVRAPRPLVQGNVCRWVMYDRVGAVGVSR